MTHLRLLAVPIGLLWALVACSGGSASGLADDTGDGGTSPWDTGEPTVGVQDTDSLGTQVGSEGFWGCDLDDTEPVYPGTLLPSFASPPEEVALPRIGEWLLELGSPDTTGATTTGGLSLVDEGTYVWFDVKDGPGCQDYLAILVSGTMRRGSDPALPVAGYLAVRPDAGKVALAATGDLDPWRQSWGEPAFGTSDDLEWHLDADIAPTSLTGSVAWTDCPEADCPNEDPLATVMATR